MIYTADFCVWSHLHWEEKKFRICILLKKAARFIQSVCICVRTALSVFLRSLCIFKILWHDVLTLTRSHWYDLQSHFFFHQCCTACCRLISLMSSDNMNHWSIHLICFFFCSQGSLWLSNVELLMYLSADLCDHFLRFWISVTSVKICNLEV